jgi:hypothetical protein
MVATTARLSIYTWLVESAMTAFVEHRPCIHNSTRMPVSGDLIKQFLVVAVQAETFGQRCSGPAKSVQSYDMFLSVCETESSI